MILDQLVLQNVGTFAARHKIELTPKSSTKPIILVGGLNGAGKTTILEAIHLAFYGTLAQSTGRRTGSYENYLRSLVHRGAAHGSTSAVELEFRANQQGIEHRYRVMRSWEGSKDPVRERLEVEVDGVADKALTSTWGEHVETFLPRGIAGLFFFDGEQIEALADMQKSREVLGSALSTLLGLDLVERLATDLAVLRRRHRMNQIPEALKAKVAEKKDAASNSRQVEETTVESLASARVELERAEKLHFELTERYRSTGGELLDKRVATESSAELHRESLDQIEAELREEAADVAPLLQISDLLKGLERQSLAEVNASNQRIVADALVLRDQAIVDMLSTASVDTSALDTIALYMSEDRTRREAEGTVPQVTGLQSPSSIAFLRESALPAARRRLASLLERRRATRAELDQLERVLVAMPDPESLQELKGDLNDASSDLVRKQATLQMVQEALTSTRADRVKADAAYESELDRLAHAELSTDDDTRIVTHVDKVKETLESLRGAATRRYLGRIGELVLEALQRLLRKESLVASVNIDPDTYTVELEGRDGNVLPANQMSAGERQLLAVSLLWGLARASGQPLPVVVDTPLGRLDGSHRGHLVDRYFPYASHQVILLSTDTEIDEITYARIKKFVGRAYRLDFDQATNSTSVLPGYFWE
ncbi:MULTISPECIES: DNA sulfur modification protein DndD [Rhodococcus]|uniref:Nuclease SbcCD subunit C n=1 Tax=Rhodococcus cerastii TaxID=908616 RepID=A0ABU4D416_9NOCA|nr:MULTISPECIES: DNA sulfur modification protein DndD [Rhodococcus]MDV6304464.1 DNA sulfur modification protein DndD [Rhodococcus cerastii]MDV8057901.1 DNA sulfur modification protein DndD [Rhodococcus sp. IEGM 1343]